MRGIYKQPKSKIWWLRYKGPDGRVIRESSGKEKFSEAKAELVNRQSAVAKNEPATFKNYQSVPFSAFAEKYLNLCKSQPSYEVKKYIIEKRLIPRFGQLPVNEFTTLAVEEFWAELFAAGYTPGYVNKVLGVLKHMFSKALDWEIVNESVLTRVRKVKAVKENKRLRYLTVEEIRDLLNTCGRSTDPLLAPIVLTALNTGMRKGEILGLEWDKHIDLKHGFITLDKTKNGHRREIPINVTLRGVLQGLTRRLDVPYVFHSADSGKRLLDVKKSFRTALVRAGIRDFKFHDLRHTFASHLIMAGESLAAVSKLLGHENIKMTMRYAHLAPGHLRNAVSTMDKITSTAYSTAYFSAYQTKKEVSGNA